MYFHHEDTALFVFEVHLRQPYSLLLNTGRKIPLVPSDLFIRNDRLYVRLGDEVARFSERALLGLEPHLHARGDGTCLMLEQRCWDIETIDD